MIPRTVWNRYGVPAMLFESIVLFIVAGLCEIGGGYLIWLWLREGGNPGFAVLGAILLVLYGIVPTLQNANFGRVYAAYGGVFIVLALLWGWRIDNVMPDRFDIIGAAIAMVGVFVIMYWPR
jgi:small multidrug resistance family-3 protein